MRQAFLLPPARGLLVSVRQGEGKKESKARRKRKRNQEIANNKGENES
jgi:hypothetical protein